MRLIVAGTGPADPQLMTYAATRAAYKADIILAPRTSPIQEGIAERVIRYHFPYKTILPIVFPMTTNKEERDSEILFQLQDTRLIWEDAKSIFFPVIGDVMLYSTARYLVSVWRKLSSKLEVEYIPGISAHSLAASYAKKFLAMGDEIFTVIPGTASRERIINALNASNSAAIYKPSAIDNLAQLVKGFTKILRVDYAGIPELETITEGIDALYALEGDREYMTIILLWRN